MPQIMGNEIPDYMSDDKKEMNHVMSPYNVVWNVNFQFQVYFEYE